MLIKPICQNCNIREREYNYRVKETGVVRYRKLCSHCNEIRSDPTCYKRYKKNFCEECGFVAKDPCQLDVDHVDGNKSNVVESNLRTLCANCHRLKTKLFRDWMPNK